jgi:hypothetical protein
MNNPENTEGDIKNEQTRETDNKTKLKKTKTQHSMKYITVHYLWRCVNFLLDVNGKKTT